MEDGTTVQASAGLNTAAQALMPSLMPDHEEMQQAVAAKRDVYIVMFVGGPGIGKSKYTSQFKDNKKYQVHRSLSSDHRFELFEHGEGNKVLNSYDVELQERDDGMFDIKNTREHAGDDVLKKLRTKLVFEHKKSSNVWKYDGTSRPYGRELTGVPVELKTNLQKATEDKNTTYVYEGGTTIETQPGNYITTTRTRPNKKNKTCYWIPIDNHWIYQVLRNDKIAPQYSLQKLRSKDFNALLGNELSGVFRDPGQTYFVLDKNITANNFKPTLDVIETAHEQFNSTINLHICICVPNYTSNQQDVTPGDNSGNFFSAHVEGICINRVIHRDHHPTMGTASKEESNMHENNLIRFVIQRFNRSDNHREAWKQHGVGQGEADRQNISARAAISKEVEKRGSNKAITFKEIPINIENESADIVSGVFEAIQQGLVHPATTRDQLIATPPTVVNDERETRQNAVLRRLQARLDRM